MTSTTTSPFTTALRLVLDETFDDVKGIYLDKGTAYHLGEVRQALCTLRP